MELLFGELHAPYFPGPEFDFPDQDEDDGVGHCTGRMKRLTQEARELWSGYRDIEEYAREVFPVEEEANGMEWMKNDKKCT